MKCCTFLAPLNGRSPVPIVFISASIFCHSSAAIRLEFLMLTDVAGAAGSDGEIKEWRGLGDDEDRQLRAEETLCSGIKP